MKLGVAKISPAWVWWLASGFFTWAMPKVGELDYSAWRHHNVLGLMSRCTMPRLSGHNQALRHLDALSTISSGPGGFPYCTH
jgi:hypothetical protein